MLEEVIVFEKHTAIFKDRDYDAIKTLISSENFDINDLDRRGATVLHYAVELGNVELVKFMLGRPKVNINAQTFEFGSTPLILATANKNLEVLICLLEKGADSSIANSRRQTPLILAASSGFVEGVEVLLRSKSCKINAVDYDGNNALMKGMGHPEIVKRLVDLTDLNHENFNQSNAFHIACTTGSFEVIRLLLDKKNFDLNKPDKNFETPIILAIKQKRFDLVEFLIEKGANLLHKTNNTLCAFHYFVIHDDNEILLEKYRCPDDIVITLLELAAKHNRTKTLRNCMSRVKEMGKFDFQTISAAVSLALQSASSGNLECVKFLVSTNLIGKGFFEPCLKVAIRGNHVDCFKHIYYKIPGTVNINKELLLAEAVNYSCFEVCKMFLEEGLNPDGSDQEDITYLMIASARGNLKIIQLLLDHGAYLNLVAPNGTAIAFAVMNGNLEVVKFLLDKGANPILADEFRITPFVLAIYKNYFEIFKILYENRPNARHKHNYGLVLFNIACTTNNEEFVKLLIADGTDLNGVDNTNNNCFHHAARHTKSLPVLLYLAEQVKDLDGMLKAKNKEGKRPLEMIINHADFSYLSRMFHAKPEIFKHFDGPRTLQIQYINTKEICLICRDEFIKGDIIKRLPCKHFFHRSCLLQWLNNYGKCPYCKAFPFTNLKN